MNSLLNYLFLVSYKYAYYSKTEFIETSVIHITSCLDILEKIVAYLFSKLINYELQFCNLVLFTS